MQCARDLPNYCKFNTSDRKHKKISAQFAKTGTKENLNGAFNGL